MNINNQFENSFDLSIPDQNEEYYLSPKATSKSSGITLLMKTVLLYTTHAHLFHSIIQSFSIEDINKTNTKGWTALMIAVHNCNTYSDIECVKLLLACNANINIKTSDGWTALMMACRYCNTDSTIECVNLLFAKGGSFNFEYNDIVALLNILFKMRIMFIDDMFEYHQYIPDNILDKLDRRFQFHYYQTGYRLLNQRIQNINDFQQCRRKGIGLY